MPVITRKVVFQAVRARSPEQRKALSQKLGKNWSHATTGAIAQEIGMQGTPRKSAAKGTARAKATTQQHGFARSFASENAAKNLSDNETKRALIKGRLVRSVKAAMTAKEKELGRKLDPKEKKAVAARAFSNEVKAIRSGAPEQKGRRKQSDKKMSVVEGGQKTKGKGKASLTSVDGGRQTLRDLFAEADRIGSKYQDPNDPADLNAKRVAKQFAEETGLNNLSHLAKTGQRLRAIDGGKGKKPGPVTDIESKRKKTKSSFSHTPPPGVSVAEHRAALRRQYGAESGSRTENLSRREERRAEVGAGDEGRTQIRRAKAADRVTEPKNDNEFNVAAHPVHKITSQQWTTGLLDGTRTVSDLHRRSEELKKEIAIYTDRGWGERNIVAARKGELAALADAHSLYKKQQQYEASSARSSGDDRATEPGKLTNAQQKAIAAHLRKVESGAASSVPLRALQDKDGQHWLEMRSSSGRVGAVPIDSKGRKDNDRAVHSSAWEQKSKGMKVAAEFPAGRKTKAVKAEAVPDAPKKQTVGDRIRATADSLQAETEIQKKATARILGASAQMSENHDRLIGEVSDMVNEDLNNAQKKGKVKKVRGKKTPTVTRGTKTKATAFDSASTPIAQPRAKTTRGRTID